MGAPQGSPLAPILFNIYMNELGRLKLTGTLFQFADDTVLVLSDSSYEKAKQLFQNDIKDIMSWFADNLIFVNTAKTKLVCIWNRHKKINLRDFFFTC